MSCLEPWAHQRSAAEWLEARQYGYVAHEMGTGKTRSLLSAYASLIRVLVVCPIAVGPAWAKQVGLFDVGRRVVVATSGSSAKKAAAIRDALATPGRVLVVVNYDSVWRGDIAKIIQATQWDAIVLDEAHRIKSPSGKASKWLAKLGQNQPQARRACLSGTPTPQSPLDWWAQLNFLDPTLVGGSFTSFRSRIANTHPRIRGWVTSFRPDALQALRARIDQHVHRVTAAEVLALPDAVHTVIPVEMSANTRRFYESLEQDMIATIGDGVVTAANPMVVVGRLQGATSGFSRIDGDDSFTLIDETPAKRLAFSEFLLDFPAREPLVVFCKFTEDIRQCKAAAVESGRTVSELSGSQKQLEEWQSGKTDVIVVQQQSGGAGIDLTRAAFCVYWSLSHSLGDYEQSLARIRRPGQAKCCRYYHLVCTDSVDETIYEALQEKKDVVESVLARLTKRTDVGIT